VSPTRRTCGPSCGASPRNRRSRRRSPRRPLKKYAAPSGGAFYGD
jgi:hypothetical protein